VIIIPWVAGWGCWATRRGAWHKGGRVGLLGDPQGSLA
jgi:hypothetical protein